MSVHRAAVTHLAWVTPATSAPASDGVLPSTSASRVVVTADSTGRVFLTHVRPSTAAAASESLSSLITVETPVRLDHLSDIATLHKFHSIVSLDVSPSDASCFLVATANGRLTVWRVGIADNSGASGAPLEVRYEAAWCPLSLGLPVTVASYSLGPSPSLLFRVSVFLSVCLSLYRQCDIVVFSCMSLTPPSPPPRPYFHSLSGILTPPHSLCVPCSTLTGCTLLHPHSVYPAPHSLCVPCSTLTR